MLITYKVCRINNDDMSQLLQEMLCRITGGQLLCRLQLPRRAKATKAKEGGYRVGLLCPVGYSVLGAQGG